MIWQLHQHFSDGHVVICAQREFHGDEYKVNKWIGGIKKTHPLPSDATWSLCSEDAECFILRMENKE